MRKYFYLLIFNTILLSCNNDFKYEKENLELKNQILEKERQLDFYKNQLSELENRLQVLEFDKDQNRKSDDSNQLGNVTYYFVVLNVIDERPTMKTKQVIYTSDVDEVMKYSSELKYKILDKIVADYKNRYIYGDVTKREIYTFNTYEEASIEREKFTTH
ncbi:MAG: hypothetical protein K0Q82_1091 [Chryseobacterium indoltheticum]|jgi:hypothetical protein|nr:hypothetical protein [Chryseobacterium indoltheticum]